MDRGGMAGQAREARIAGVLALVGAGSMGVGAGIWASTGTDLDAALVTDEMAAYLAAAAEHRPALVANLSIWIVGVLGLGVAGTAISRVGDGPSLLRDLARFTYWVATPLAISAFVAWLAIVVQLTGAAGDARVGVAEVVGWYAYRADGVATALIVGVGPALLSWAGSGDWAPRWLLGWGLLAALAGVLSFLPYYVPLVPVGLAFLIVPVGLGWTIAAGVVLVRMR